MKLFIFLLGIIGMSFTHDVQTAFFTISQNGDSVYLATVFESDDLVKALNIKKKNIDKMEIQQYLDQHFKIELNNIPTKFNIEKIKMKRGHIECNARFGLKIDKIESVTIFNDCLLDLEDQYNVIELRLNNSERDFLMNRDRTNINVSY